MVSPSRRCRDLNPRYLAGLRSLPFGCWMWRVGTGYLPVTQKMWEKMLMQLGEKVYKLWTSQREACLALALTPDQLDLELGRRALCPAAVLSLVLPSARHHPHPPTPSQMMNRSSLPRSELVSFTTQQTRILAPGCLCSAIRPGPSFTSRSPGNSSRYTVQAALEGKCPGSMCSPSFGGQE